MNGRILISSLAGTTCLVLGVATIAGIGAMFSDGWKPMTDGVGAKIVTAPLIGIYFGGMACLAAAVFIALPYAAFLAVTLKMAQGSRNLMILLSHGVAAALIFCALTNKSNVATFVGFSGLTALCCWVAMKILASERRENQIQHQDPRPRE